MLLQLYQSILLPCLQKKKEILVGSKGGAQYLVSLSQLQCSLQCLFYSFGHNQKETLLISLHMTMTGKTRYVQSVLKKNCCGCLEFFQLLLELYFVATTIIYFYQCGSTGLSWSRHKSYDFICSSITFMIDVMQSVETQQLMNYFN